MSMVSMIFIATPTSLVQSRCASRCAGHRRRALHGGEYEFSALLTTGFKPAEPESLSGG
jgi:hypothetical protein